MTVRSHGRKVSRVSAEAGARMIAVSESMRSDTNIAVAGASVAVAR